MAIHLGGWLRRPWTAPPVAFTVPRPDEASAALKEDAEVRVFELATGLVVASLRLNNRLDGACWSPDGTRFYAYGDRGLHALSWAGR